MDHDPVSGGAGPGDAGGRPAHARTRHSLLPLAAAGLALAVLAGLSFTGAGRIGGAAGVAGLAVLLGAVVALALEVRHARHEAQAHAFCNVQLVRELDAQARRLEEQVAIARAGQEEALRLSEERGRFFASASHDLRQPVHALALSADLLAKRLAGTPFAEDIQRLLTSLDELASSLNRMLDISRLDAGAVVPQPRRVELAEVFAELHRQFGGVAQQKDLALRFRAGEHALVTDPALLARLLGNLLDNALKYTATGGVMVAARRRTQAPHDLVLEVRDSGIGIAGQHQQAVFEEFFQVENPARNRGEGLGLGLSIARRLAALLGMPLELASAPGCGTTFRLRCRAAGPGDGVPGPAPAPHDEARAVPPGELARALHGAHVLVVDNEAAIVDAVVAVLASQGCRVRTAGSPIEALLLVKDEGPFRLAIVDYRLGGGRSGAELAADLAALQLEPLALLMITGETDPARIARIRDAGIAVCFKPLRAQQLLEAAARQLLAPPQVVRYPT